MFERFIETLESTGKTVSEKTKSGTEVVKLSYKVSSSQRDLAEIYAQIGKLCYEEYKDAEKSDAMADLFAQASLKNAEIDELKAKIRELKGVNLCTECGAEVPADNDFCGKCGARIVKPAAPAEVSEEAPAEETAEDAPAQDTAE
jgi:rRNA maturation endonuclease Nob1